MNFEIILECKTLKFPSIFELGFKLAAGFGRFKLQTLQLSNFQTFVVWGGAFLPLTKFVYTVVHRHACKTTLSHEYYNTTSAL